MQPLSRKTRLTYLLLCGVAFCISIPLAILYASGYRLEDGFSLAATGGVYVTVPVSDAVVSLNGEEIGVTGLFTKNFYVDQLAPGSYAVHVALPGYYPWYRTLTVEPHIVTDAQAVLLPEQVMVYELVRGVAPVVASSTKESTAVNIYDSYLLAFATSTAKSVASSTEPIPVDTQGGLALYLDKGDVRLAWTRATSTIPSTLCAAPSECVREMRVERGRDKAISATFFAGGVLYATENGGVFLAEADLRPSPLTIPVYPRRGSDFRVIDGKLIIKDGKTLYRVEGF